MILKYGNYAHADGEINFTCQRRALFTSAGIPYAEVETWYLRGILLPDSGITDLTALQANLTTKINALKSAYSVHGKDAILYLSDGVTPSSHALRNSLAVAPGVWAGTRTVFAPGVRVIQPPYFEDGAGAEYCTYRTYTIVLEAEFQGFNQFGLTNSPNAGAITKGQTFTEFQQSIVQEGTGSERVWTRPLRGEPRLVTVRERTPIRIVQEGYAKGYLAEPQAPDPMDLGELVSRTTGTSRDGDGRSSTVSWRYEFGSTGGGGIGAGISGLPTVQLGSTPNLGFDFFAPRA